MPGLIVEAIPHVAQEVGIKPDWEASRAFRLLLELHVIWVDVDQGHAAVPGNPIQFAEPKIGGRLAEEEEEGVVLGEGVGQFDVAGGQESGVGGRGSGVEIGRAHV